MLQRTKFLITSALAASLLCGCATLKEEREGTELPQPQSSPEPEDPEGPWIPGIPYDSAVADRCSDPSAHAPSIDRSAHREDALLCATPREATPAY